MKSSRPYWVVGPGRMGLALGSVLAAADAATELIFIGRRERAPDHPLFRDGSARYLREPTSPPAAGACVLLAVPDGEVEAAAAALARLGPAERGCAALHLSGALPAAALAGLNARGYATGSLHPLQTVADPARGPARLRGAYFTFEGEPAAREAATALVNAAGGRLLEVRPADKVRYHAACVFASNYLVACAAVAARLLAAATGISRAEAVEALRPLWRGAVANLEESGLPGALTGPVARGDVGTVRAHLGALDGELRELYRRLALEALELGRELGVERDVAATLWSELGGTSREAG